MNNQSNSKVKIENESNQNTGVQVVKKRCGFQDEDQQNSEDIERRVQISYDDQQYLVERTKSDLQLNIDDSAKKKNSKSILKRPNNSAQYQSTIRKDQKGTMIGDNKQHQITIVEDKNQEIVVENWKHYNEDQSLPPDTCNCSLI